MPPPTVVLTCGSSGSGKTTFARALEERGFVRLGLDGLVRERFGLYGRDVAVESYQELNDAVEPELRRRLVALITAGHDVVVDKSFWSRAERDVYKALVTEAGGRWRLVHFDVSAPELRRRVQARRSRGDADAFPATDEILDHFHTTFEAPRGEGAEPPEAVLADLGG